MVGRDFKWVVGLVLVVASGAYWLHRWQPEATLPQPLRVELLLGADRQFTQKFQLTLESHSAGAGFDTLLTVAGTSPPFDRHGAMDRDTFEKLERSLVRAGLWTIADGDDSDSEDLVLYTRLTATQGSRKHSSLWRGLPGQQYRDLAGCFMQGPWGDTLSQGLQALSAFKHMPPAENIIR